MVAKILVLENFESNETICNEMYQMNVQIRNADINLQYQQSLIISILKTILGILH